MCGLEFSPVLNLQQAVAETSNLGRQLQKGVETLIGSDRMGALPCNCARGCNYNYTCRNCYGGLGFARARYRTLRYIGVLKTNVKADDG